ncbi:enoyl-CoA hydratase [Sphingobium baderi LL03]|nr:enoyl-CoA hydratase [Sphingobium baderi LL03]
MLYVTIDNADRHNRVDAAMHKELSRLFYEIGEDPESDVVVLSAAGRFFGVGGDLDYMRDQIEDPNLFHRSVREAKRIIYGILECDKPIVARVHGDAIGLAATMALACDIVIADEEATIVDPHVRVGLVAGDGGALLWPQMIGYARAKYHLLTGRPLKGREAAGIGLIARAVPTAELDGAVEEIARELASGATKAIRWTKSTVNSELQRMAHSIMDIGMAYEAVSGRTHDHDEAIKAFREKRSPEFKQV